MLSLLINNLHLRFDYIVSIVICIEFSNILDFNVSSTLSNCVWDDTLEPRSCHDQVGVCDHVMASRLMWWSGQGC